MKKFQAPLVNRYLFNKINPILFDVSLRDGIQGADPEKYETHTKINLLRMICKNYNPPKIEFGSFVSPKVLPIMADTAYIFDYIQAAIKQNDIEFEPYALVPNKKGLFTAIHKGVRNFSFITSVSNAFQKKNTRRDLEYKKTELEEMTKIIEGMSMHYKTKLYISCINECPIDGLIDKDFIMHEILSSYKPEKFNEICLSDTMGTLKHADFEYIVDGLIRFGLPKTSISLHLHIDKENEKEAKKILFACFKRGINQFDVSMTTDGGCSVSMQRDKLKPNMTYEFFYNTLEEYIQHLYTDYNVVYN